MCVPQRKAFYTLTTITRNRHNMHSEIQASAIITVYEKGQIWSREGKDERRGMRVRIVGVCVGREKEKKTRIG
jgi:hypothetical protein